MNIGLYANDVGGYFNGAWRQPNSRLDVDSFDNHLEMAQVCEAAKLDTVFYADSPMLGDGAYATGSYEPLTLLAGIAARTSNIGLAVTQTTTYDQPYHIARRFASLDWMSGGRAAWNVVTGNTDKAGKNVNNTPLMETADRYEQAAEFVDVVTGLWDTWDDDALIRDRASGIYRRPEAVRELNHDGKYYQVKGPLNVWRPPQGHPVIIVAGGSLGARSVAATRADVMFTVQSDFNAAIDFRKEMKTAVAAAGRNPEHFKIMPGIAYVLGGTEEEAKRRLAELTELGDPNDAMDILCARLRFDVRGYDLDGPLPEIEISDQQSGYPVNIINLAKRENMTIRQLRDFTAASRTHYFVCGTPEQIADGMTKWFAGGACDGFNIMPATNPTDLHGFLDEVVPILQKRGLFRKEYEGTTLRENLGLPRPVRSQSLSQEAAVVSSL